MKRTHKGPPEESLLGSAGAAAWPGGCGPGALRRRAPSSPTPACFGYPGGDRGRRGIGVRGGAGGGLSRASDDIEEKRYRALDAAGGEEVGIIAALRKSCPRGALRIARGAPRISRGASPTLCSLDEAMSAWERYIHQNTPDLLSCTPSSKRCNGNGRLGRMLVPLFLWQRRLISRPMF